MTKSTNQLTAASRDYERVEQAIRYLDENFADQPELEDLAAAVGLSPFHFHRLFGRWVGTTPKRFLQYLTLEHAKRRLHSTDSIMEAAWDSGLSGGSRLHDLMVTIDAVTPGEFKRLGDDLEIRYATHPSPFGKCLVAVTDRGLCGFEFLAGRSPQETVDDFAQRWPRARLVESLRETMPVLGQLFPEAGSGPKGPFTLFIKGTNFQLQVWQALLRIPSGSTVTYGEIARQLGRPRASRAVGQAVGWNPISYLIPCHRVIAAAAGLGGYRWGLPRKRALLAWEASQSG